MSIVDRIKQGITLLVDSIALMRNHPRLVLFPLVAGITGLGFLVIFLGITFGAMTIRPEGSFFVGLFLVYLVMTFISTFFTAGLVHQSRQAMGGGTVSLRDGLTAAWAVKARLFVWALIAATIGVILNGIQNSDSGTSRGIGALFGIAWTLLTFFIVPVIVFERTGITGMFSRSASTFKETWGETPIGLGGVQLVAVAVMLPFVGVGYLLATTVTPVGGIGLIAAGIALAFLLAQTLEGVIKTALYVYATEGKAPREFDNVDFEQLPGDGNATIRATGGFNPGR